jgi:leucyl aminopeptidase (aminopeptidase T)
MNDKAKITGNMLEDEKVMGTCHIALGNNAGFGGKVNVELHIDGLIKKPTVSIDDKRVMNEGKLIF